MREMKDSNVNWLNAIPCEWALSRIKYVLNERIEKNDPIKTKDILSLTAKQGVIPLSKKQGGGNKPKEDFTAYKLAYPNDIVVNSMNILSGSVGLSKYFGCVSPVYYMLRPFNDNFDVRYFNYIFQTKVFQLSLFGLGNGILIKESGNGKFNTIRMRIPMEKFGNLLIPVPNKKEQQQIADYLDTQCSEIDATAEDIQKEISLLEEYKKSVITEVVTKGLNPDAEMKNSGIEWIGEIPKHWKVLRIKNVGEYRNGLTYKPTDLTDENTGTLVLRSSNIQDGKISLNDNVYVSTFVSSDLKVKKGDILICSRNGSRELVGKNAIIEDLKDVTFGAFMMIFRCNSPKYLYYILNSKVFSYYLGSFFTSTINQLTGSNFGNMKIVYVSDKLEQSKIVSYLDSKCYEIDSLIADKKRQLDILADYKKSLIYEYVTGKKEVPVNE